MTQTELIKELTGCKELSEKFLSEYESVPEEKLNGLTRQQATSYEFGKTVGYGHAIELLKNNEIEPEWTPVSERLPEDRREVLVMAYWHETYQVMMASYFGDGLWWCVPFNNCGEHMQRLKPKAWMPLPRPYKMEVVE